MKKIYKEEILENISDLDLEFAITEIRDIDDLENNNNNKLLDTIMLYEIYNKLADVEAFSIEDEYSQLCLWCSLEFSYRKIGLK